MLEQGLWYAVRVRPRYERLVSNSIELKGIKTLVPTYSVRRRWADRSKLLDIPLFDGYVFCHVDPNNRLPVLVTPGVIHFVGIGKTPVPIDASEMKAIQTVVDAGSNATPWPFLATGDRVRIQQGPLRDVEGILVRRERDHRVVISVSLLQRSIAVSMEQSWIVPIRPWLRQPPTLGESQA